ncbi:MAG TPA: iron-sulfur cluster assembly scaffold protein [Candidatus Brachybacterium merdigallinarum]|nr:iron-sulfur cluster assembly scaffold protein [Candidatus Brachybacterium merdigallinarum]
MSDALHSLYTELVVEHDKRPLHEGLREPFDAEVHHVNPTCGDEITLRLHLAPPADGTAGSAPAGSTAGEEDSRTIADISYQAVGCAMSRASASIMADLLIGRTVAEVEPVRDHFDQAIRSRGRIEADEDLIGDGVALMGAARFPARIKCVLMSWKAYEAALIEARTLGH